MPREAAGDSGRMLWENRQKRFCSSVSWMRTTQFISPWRRMKAASSSW
jgi:hypothetical protein